MIQLKDLDIGLTEVLDSDLESVVGEGIFGLTLPPARPLPSPITLPPSITANGYNTPFFVPVLPPSASPDQSLANLGFKTGDGNGNIIGIGPGSVSWENWGSGVGVQWNSDAVGISGGVTW